MRINLEIHKKILILLIVFLCADNLLWLTNDLIRTYAKEIFWIMSFLLFYIYIISARKWKYLFSEQYFIFGRIMLFPIIMALYSSVQSYFLYGQSLFQGILPQRFMLGGFLLYFVLVEYFVEYGLQERIEKFFVTFAKMELLLYVIQYLVIEQIHFLQVPYSIRLGGIRMNAGALGIHFLIFYFINKVFTERKLKISYLFWIGISFYYIFGISKTRMLIIAYSLAIGGCFWIWKNGGKRKLAVFFALVLAMVFMTQTELFKYLITGINNMDSSAQIRTIGREYYISKILDHPVFGCGYINMNNKVALSFSGYNDNIFWVDLGVFGLTFFFGIMGLIWMICWYVKLTYCSYKITQKGNYTFWMYMIYIITISVNGTGFLWYPNDTLCYILITAFIDIYYQRTLIKSKKITK